MAKAAMRLSFISIGEVLGDNRKQQRDFIAAEVSSVKKLVATIVFNRSGVGGKNSTEDIENMMRMRRNALQPVLTRIIQRGMANFVVAGDKTALDGLKTAAGKKIFYFTATWCPPCKRIGPIFERLSKEHDSITFVKIDIDDFPAIATEYGVKSVPTFFFLSGAKTVSEFSGAAEPLLVEGIQNLESSKV